MEIFDSVFWLVLGVSAVGGLVNAVNNLPRNIEYDDMTRSKLILFFLRDILIGMGAGFAAWLAESAMNNTAGILLTAFLFSLAGGVALSQLSRLVGIEEQRDLLVKSDRVQIELMEKLKQEEQRNQQLETELARVKSKLSAEEESRKYQAELSNLKEQIARLEDRLSKLMI